MTRTLRPDLLQLWPTWAAFPLFGLGVLAIGAQARDDAMIIIGLGLLLVNLLIVVDHAYFTTLRIEHDALAFDSHFGLQHDRVAIGSVQRVDAKRYPAAHSGVSAPHLVVRGRTKTLKVNIKPYRLAGLRELVETMRALNPAIEVDAFWSAVLAGQDPSTQPVARSRW